LICNVAFLEENLSIRRRFSVNFSTAQNLRGRGHDATTSLYLAAVAKSFVSANRLRTWTAKRIS